MSVLDRVDTEILRLLQQDGEMANAVIGEHVHLSASTVSRRIEALKANGYIRGFRVVLDLHQLELTTTVYTLVTLKNHDSVDLRKFEEGISAAIPYVVECVRLCGTWDYLLKFVARDMPHYGELQHKLTAMPSVRLVRSHPAMMTSEVRPLPLD